MLSTSVKERSDRVVLRLLPVSCMTEAAVKRCKGRVAASLTTVAVSLVNTRQDQS